MDINKVKLREYEQIFTGSNQQLGYDKPFLEFSADTKKIIFNVDKTTYFHFPEINTESFRLSACGLIESGAIAGSIPYRSDRIWKKDAGYTKDIYWGDDVGYDTGIWFCSWLSGNNTDKPVWKDRFYNPGKVVYDNNTLSLSSFIYTAPSGVIIDIDSEIDLEPGVWYRYDHMGDNYNLSIVNQLTGTDGLLKCNINEWSESTEDLSPYNNIIYLVNPTSEMILDKALYSKHSGILLNGYDQYCKIAYNNILQIKDNLTASIWLHTKDWNNQETQNLFGNEFRGGWAIRYDNGFYNPILAAISNTGKLLILNTDGTILITKDLPGDSIPVKVLVDNNNFIWVLDDGLYESYKHLYKLDYNGDIIDKIDLSPSLNLIDIDIGNSNILYLLCDNISLSNQISALNIDLNDLQIQNIDITYNIIPYVINKYISTNLENKYNIYDDSYNTIFNDLSRKNTETNPEFSWVINNDIYYHELDYKTYNYTISIPNTINGCTDSLGKAWIIHDTNKIKVIDNNDINFSSISASYDGYEFTHICMSKEVVDGILQDIAWISDETNKQIYKIDSSLNVINIIDLDRYECAPIQIANNYEWSRKFNYIFENNKIAQIKGIIHTDVYTSSADRVQCPITDAASNDWNLYTLTYYSSSNDINLCINSVNKDRKTGSVNKDIYYEYKNFISAGSSVGKVESLSQELKNNRMYFNGKIDDIRIYNCILNTSDLLHIYRTKYDFNNIVWNMPIKTQYFLEEIDRFFKCKIPGMKSQFYNIKIKGLKIDNTEVQQMIEDIIKNTLSKTSPSYTKNFKIIWE
jgi:hypothetical protein